MKRYVTRQVETVPPDYPARINGLRTKHSLTQARLADLLGVSIPLVSQWESGRARPTPAMWHRLSLAEQLGLRALSTSGDRLQELMAAYEAGDQDLPMLEFTADPEQVRTAVEAERLEYGYRGHCITPEMG